ncbi:MAG: SpoIVB peptidase S55 domain-containing protein [Aminobacterium sp.]|nr:SpoIVB peptidase S55 domain-containing protein [Aminobacterium sp.]MDD3425891.1 SpoIVB peptidase S55 domain-containing protein [Aminobacterium sp.]MDD3706727.1 SpoIVB peptidase S55 domain-containing protein [Aminobacterium sp.]MDD4228161.1 SpoIVB peptidase S55 domain-containing protein [Aminobacterium sp.]MDD4550906.1 SpoIVB peptidase S55 domain-containing protein [Aminobacterium sp.]
MYKRPLSHIFFVCLILTLLVTTHVSWASQSSFKPTVPVLPLEDLKPGMKGYALTVIQGQKVVSFPVEIISIVPQLESRPRHLIMIRVSGDVIDKTGGIAAGMSGSPVYIGQKLIGAIGYGFNFSEHNIGYVTPIEDMATVWNWPEVKKSLPKFTLPLEKEDEKESHKEETQPEEDKGENEEIGTNDTTSPESPSDQMTPKALPLQISGVSQRTVNKLENVLGEKAVLAGGISSDEHIVDYKAAFSPGDGVGVLLAWGDVTVGAIGTVTSVDKDGRFLAFGHPFLERGAVAFPAAKVNIHNVIPNLASPFKIGSFSQIVGTITQDRAEAIGGQVGYFTPSIDASLRFKDVDRNVRALKRFHVVPDPFMSSEMTSILYTGLIDRLWGRIGEGTARVSLQIEGYGLPKGWTRSNMFFSESNIGGDSLREIQEIIKAITLNPYKDIYPLGIHLSVEMTQKPNLIFIEGLKVEGETFRPGDKIPVEITLRPYRGEQSKKKFELIVPQDAAGPVEIAVRGGGIMPLEEDAIIQGWKTIENFDQMLKEISALETNNEVILELNYAKVPDETSQPGPTKEDLELLSQIKERRLNEGSMRIFRTDYVVEGLLRKIVQIVPETNNRQERE